MPNYCDNILTLTVLCNNDDADSSLQTFYKENYGNEYQPLTFQHAAPVLDSQDNNSVWGTKWDAIQVEFVEESETTYIYDFQTAWSPPIGWLQIVASKYPEIRFEIEFSEPGCDFWGKDIYENGVNIVSEESTLGEHNWIHANKVILESIVEKYRDVILSDNHSHTDSSDDETNNQTNNQTNDDDIVETIIEEFALVDSYSENIYGYVSEFIDEWKYSEKILHPIKYPFEHVYRDL